MKSADDILKKITKLIVEKRLEGASKEFFAHFEKDLIGYITKKLGWDKDEAYNILHDAYILIQEKVLNNELALITGLTVFQTCKYIGANKFRKTLTERGKLNKYMQEEKLNFISDFKEQTGFGFEPDESIIGSRKEKALRAFSLLKDQCQKMLIMKFVEGYNHQLIAHTIPGISGERSSITILSRCVKKWREFFNII